MKVRQPPSIRNARAANMAKMKKQVSNRKTVEKPKKKDQNVNSIRRKKVKSKEKKMKQKRKIMQGNRQKTKFLGKSAELEKCMSLWAELTNVGLGVATILKKLVMDML